MDPHNPAPPQSPVGGHEIDSSSTASPPTSTIITTPLTVPASIPTPAAGVPSGISPPSPPTTPIATMSDLSGPPWPRPPTPRPPLPLPDRVCGLDGANTPPGTPIAGPSFPQPPFSSYPVASSQSGPLTLQPVDDRGSPIPVPDIFEPPKEDSGTRPVLRLRPETGVGEPHGNVESHGVMRSLDEIVNSSGFEIGDLADEDFYADADIGSGSEASSLSSLWASRAYLDHRSGYLGESVRAGPPDHEHHLNNDDNGAGEGNKKGKRKACDCAYCDPDSDPHHDGYFSDSGTATGDEGPRRAGPFVPSFHDSQTAPVKRGSFVFRNSYEGENRDMHERGGDGEDEVIVSVGCELEFPLAPERSEGQRISDEVARFAPPGPGREIHRLPASVPVCIRKPPARAVSYRGRRRYRTGSPEFIPDPSIIQLLTPQGTVGAQFNNVADVQVTAEIGLLGGGYGMREIRSNGGCDEVIRGWGGVKGSVIEFKGGDKWELNLKGKEAELNKEAKMGRDSPSGFYDGDDEGTIGAASDPEGAVAQLNAQPANQDFVLGPGETRPYILDVIHDDPNKPLSRYANVGDYSINLRGSEKGDGFTVRLRDRRGSLVIMWKRVARVEIVHVGGVVIEINAGDGESSEDDGAKMAGRGVDLRGGGDKGNGNGYSQGEKGLENIGADKGKGRATTDSSTVGSLPSNDEIEAEVPQKTRQGKGKGKAVEDGDVTPRNHYHSDSESHGSIPLFFETPADYVQTLGPPHRIENPEPDYVLGSCPCLDRPITDADTNAGPPQCTCIRPASPETPVPEPWTGGYFSPRYQEFLRSGPPNEPYSHSCTAYEDSHGEWVSEVRGNLEENIANHASSSKGPEDAVPPNRASSVPKPLGSPSGDAPKKQRDDDDRRQVKSQGGPGPVSGLEGQPEGDTPVGSRNGSHVYSSQRENVANEGTNFTNEIPQWEIPQEDSRKPILIGVPMSFIHFKDLFTSLPSIPFTLHPHPFTFQDSLPSPRFNSSHPTNSQASITNTLHQHPTPNSRITAPLSRTPKTYTPTTIPRGSTNLPPSRLKSQKATISIPTADLQDSASPHHLTKVPGNSNPAATTNMRLLLPRKTQHASRKRQVRSQLL
ncbi:hypothetical protein VE01_09579 [Pseudogymnoascus verrucosus]|uniref:Uncharacterized protein n=1 Tax=Pseudogymnoascus verrucosus TaxID=342668 RepID=A0A1B8G9H5_9PEZI|nr:uncharacterized protein VE01_09579 [Pseudogymnoascus verrucosus]OBT92476.1 hypothetical protein VE01_09579 [Pseudogymnoascus verrucosus]